MTSAPMGTRSTAGAQAESATAVSATQARRELMSRARCQPGWLVTATVAGGLAGLAAIPQATLLTAILDGAFLKHQVLAALHAPLAWLLLVIVARALATAAGTAAGRRAGARVALELRAEMTSRLLELGPAYLERRRSGTVSAEVLEGIDRIEPFIARFLPQAVLTVAVPVLIAAYVLRLDLLSGVILLVTGPLIPLFMVLLGSLAEQRAQRQWRALGLLSAQALEAIQGLETLRLFGRARDHEDAMARVGERYRRTTLEVLKVAFLSGFALELLAMLGTAMVAVTVGVRLASGALPFGIAMITLLLAPEFYLPFRQLGAHHHAAMEGVAAARDLLGKLAHVGAPAVDRVVEQPLRAPAAHATMRATAARGDAGRSAAAGAPLGPPRVSFRQVHARYPGAASDALRGIELDLEPGAITALVGRTGAGKSSLARLLIGTLQARAGSVLVDDFPIEAWPSEAWRARLAFVPQRPHLFAGTVLDNLRLGRPDATDAEVAEAARDAEADAFIRALPRGYATVLGEDGLDLSGGERHRLAIARAFVRRADVVILDEITAHLDAPTEVALGRAVAHLADRSTVLIIAHRLATVRRADRIAVMDEGRVVEQGRHAELLARHGAYARLVGASGPHPEARGAA